MVEIKIENELLCRVCDTSYKSAHARNKCIQSHGLTLKEYIVKYFLDDIPMCKCGCGTPVKKTTLHKDIIRYSEYTTNHFPRKPHTKETKEKIKLNTKKAIKDKYGVENVFQLDKFKHKIKKTNQKKYGVDNPAKCRNVQEKLKKTCIERFGYSNIFLDPVFRKKHIKKKSKYEKLLTEKLNGKQSIIVDGKEFDIKVGNLLIDVDGDYYHPNQLVNLSLTQINSVLNDYEKDLLIDNNDEYSLIRIKTSEIPNDITLDNIINESYNNDFKLGYNDIIINKEYLTDYINKYGKDKLEKYIPMLLKFVRTFSPNFPTIVSNESPNDVIKYIRELDVNRIYIGNDTFKNNAFNKGVSLLKSIFDSYWDSSFNSRLSPIEAWDDDKIMYNLIKYRIGINNDNHISDFSLRNLVYALNVNRYCVSFFKPALASAIYTHYLGETETPIVLDPCAGFGGRLVGFKCKYPKGTYIGVEPNIDTYNGLKKIVELFGFKNVILINDKIENAIIPIDYDFTFTSIPYYNKEDYNNMFNYSTVDDWMDTFINSLFQLDNLILNVDIDTYNLLSDKFDICGKINKNRSPFNSTKENYELLIKLK